MVTCMLISDSVLALADVCRQQQLTPKAKKFYTHLLKTKKIATQYERRQKSLKQRLQAASRYIQEGHWEELKSLGPIVYNFIMSQIRNISSKKTGRHYLPEDKIFALALYKQSPKAYRYLARLFCLPSPETIRKVIRHIPVKPGICEAVFETMKFKVSKMKSIKQKCCVLIFDEMSLRPHLSFNKHLDSVEGFTDNGFHRKSEIADHVQVWLLRSVSVEYSWKQPVAFSFTRATESWENIMFMYKTIIKKCQDIGLKVVASVCDQGSSNTKAIKELVDQSRAEALRCGLELRHNVIRIGEDDIVPLFDPPHLMKCIRNNLLTKNLKFVMDGKLCTAKWSHIEAAYNIDVSSGNLRIMKNLSEFHILPTKIQKMRVSRCTQVFSDTVASVMALMARNETSSLCGRWRMPSEASDTARLLLLFDRLFDSVNGGVKGSKKLKHLRLQTLTTGSCHQEVVWNEAIHVIRTMEFEKVRPNDRARPEVLKNWIFTLQGFKVLRAKLSLLGFSKFATRSFNQDPLENFFGQIRQHGVCNVNPTCAAFSPFFKSLLLNNFSTFHSKHGNCENDENHGLLVTLNKFVKQQSQTVHKKSHDVQLPQVPQAILEVDFESLQTYVVSYVAGYVVKHLIPLTKKCTFCSNNLLHNSEPLEIHSYIRQKDIGQKLIYCNVNFINCVVQICNIVHFFLPSVSYAENFSNAIRKFIKENINFNFKDCEHRISLEATIVSNITNLIIFNYFNIINKILNKKETPKNMDNLQKKALALVRK